jgi:hypothetical protein
VEDEDGEAVTVADRVVVVWGVARRAVGDGGSVAAGWPAPQAVTRIKGTERIDRRQSRKRTLHYRTLDGLYGHSHPLSKP